MESGKYKITVISHSKTSNHTSYIIKIEKDNKSITFSERYSNLKSFHDSLKKETNNNALPKFPPKKFFGSEDEKFLIKRQQELNNYFEALCSNDEFTSLPAFKKFIENAKNIGKNTTNSQIEQPKKIQEAQSNDINSKVTKEIKNSKNTEEEYSKIIGEYVKKFIDMGYAAEQEISEENEKKYLKLFSEVKFEGGNSEIDKNINKDGEIEAGKDDNFNLIGNTDGSVIELENCIMQKMESLLKDYKTFEEVYNTSQLIVPI